MKYKKQHNEIYNRNSKKNKNKTKNRKSKKRHIKRNKTIYIKQNRIQKINQYTLQKGGQMGEEQKSQIKRRLLREFDITDPKEHDRIIEILQTSSPDNFEQIDNQFDGIIRNADDRYDIIGSTPGDKGPRRKELDDFIRDVEQMKRREEIRRNEEETLRGKNERKNK